MNTHYKARAITSLLNDVAKQFPVVMITGPRQSGKSTLVQHVFPTYRYVTLEEPDARDYAQSDPRGFLSQYAGNTIIDEFQQAPDLLSYMQTHVDRVDEPGMYILTGSNQFATMDRVSQSLAGRCAILVLLPLSFAEAYEDEVPSLEKLMIRGFYPRLFNIVTNAHVYYSSYFNTYLQKDVRNVKNIHDLSLFQRFIQLCAGRTGHLVNYNSLAGEIGIDLKTAKSWLGILQASYIVDLLQPLHANISKRIIKTPKLYFYDVGLAAYLLGINDASQLHSHPLRGELFETFLYAEIKKYIYSRIPSLQTYFYRTVTGDEVDFVLQSGISQYPIEVKLTKTPGRDQFTNLIAFSRTFENTQVPLLVYGGDDEKMMYGCQLIPFSRLHAHLLTVFGALEEHTHE